jgi:hypothetical protein
MPPVLTIPPVLTMPPVEALPPVALVVPPVPVPLSSEELQAAAADPAKRAQEAMRRKLCVCI